MKRKHIFLVLLLVVAGLFLAVEVYARAGGGGGYAGGGGGGGGSGGSGGGGGDGVIVYLFIRWWILFCMRVPLVGVPVTIVGVVLFIKYGGKFRQQQQGRTIARGRQVQEKTGQDNAIARIRERDPGFSDAAFSQRIEKAFVLLQDAWTKQDISSVRSFISDGIVERFSLQFEEQKAKGFRNRMKDVNVQQVRMAQVETDDVFDTITVAISASAVDFNESLETGKKISGSTIPESFTEYWSFVRRPGAKSLSGDGLIEGNCPNCGAQLVLNEVEKCSSCGALVRSGEYDWVLTEITQACEWVAKPSKSVPGVTALKETDPGFSTQNLEDRVSVMFWRTMMALRTGQIEPIRKMALPSFCEDMKKQMQPDEKGISHCYEDCAVGAVDTVGILLDDDGDRAVVSVRWSGAGTGRERNGKEKLESAAHVISELYVLVRKSGTTTDINLALSSAHCPSCGAAVHDEASDSCEYCGAVLNDGSTGWVLEKILKVYSKEAMALQKTFADAASVPVKSSGRSSLEQAAWMIQVMLADGHIDDKEKQTLLAFAKGHGISRERIESMISSMKAGRLNVVMPKDDNEAREWLEIMAEMVLADGKITAPEQQAMLNMAKRLNITQADINRIINRKRTDLYQQSKQHIKTAKKVKRR